MARRKVVVIGGGAAGLMAAGQAAAAGADTLLLEKMKRLGMKIAISGKGRCNITNIAEVSDFITHFGKTGNFLRQSFYRFFATDLMDFFQELGLKLVTERGGRVFPASGSAHDVIEVLRQWVEQSGAKIKFSSGVDKLIIKNGQIKGVISRSNEIPCNAVILATGGASYPRTGSTGDGYGFAQSAGHNLVPIRPALVPLETASDVAEKMAGLHLRNINVSMFINGKKRKEAFGEMKFTKFGVTGPVILTLSGKAVDALENSHMLELSLDLKPALDEKKLDARLLRDFESQGKEPFSRILAGLLPQDMIATCIELTGIPPDRPGCQISAKERRRLRTWLKDFRLKVTGHRPYSEAIVTAGGIDTKELNPRTMESLKTKGLFLAGELLNIHADTGGYNLQAAFSTGWLAGHSAADNI